MEHPGTMVITGGAQGIGRITAEIALQAGYNVAVWDSDREAIVEEMQRWKEDQTWLGISCDVSDEKDVISAIEKTLSRFGSIDVLVNNAAIHANMPLADLPVEAWRRVLDVNLTGPLICTKYCAPQLKSNKGSVINICSTRAFQSEAHTEAYTASKGGVFSLTHALAISLGPDIRVNSISPGWIDVSSVKKKDKAHQEVLSLGDHAQHPAGRVGVGADIGRMILFLCDPRNSFIAGQNFVIDGGMTRKMIYF
jgi:NAD(P)-dependent dehydrogenase (short-subunit alcohol dehydrogenase family)